jgi:hypothetical protein
MTSPFPVNLNAAALSTFDPMSMDLRPMAGTRKGRTCFFAKTSPERTKTS